MKLMFLSSVYLFNGFAIIRLIWLLISIGYKTNDLILTNKRVFSKCGLISTTSSSFKFRFIRDGQTLYNDIFNQLEISEVESRNLDAKAIVVAMAEKLS